MQWYKHDTDASQDARIKKLILRHGPIGYAVYFHCLELIAGDVTESNITFELEHDAEIIADNLKIQGNAEKSGREIAEAVMRDIIDLGLFEENNGRIFCFKLLKRLDQSMTSNQKLRALIADARKNHDKIMISHDAVMINPDSIMQEENRRDKKRGEEKREEKESAADAAPSARKRFIKPTEEEVYAYFVSIGIDNPSVETQKFFSWYEGNGWKVGKNPMKDWRATCRTWKLRRDEDAKLAPRRTGYQRPGIGFNPDDPDQRAALDRINAAVGGEQ